MWLRNAINWGRNSDWGGDGNWSVNWGWGGLVVLVSDEENLQPEKMASIIKLYQIYANIISNLWLLWEWGRRLANLDIGSVVTLLHEDVDNRLLLFLFWEEDFSLLVR